MTSASLAKVCAIAALGFSTIAALVAPSALHAGVASSANRENSCHSTPVAEGCGEFALPDGTTYFGPFHEGHMHGEATVVFADNSTLEADLEAASAAPSIATFVPAGGEKITGRYVPPERRPDCSHRIPSSVIPRPPANHSEKINYVVVFEVDKTGHVISADLLQPFAALKLAEAAIARAKVCQYSPATIDGHPVESISWGETVITTEHIVGPVRIP